MQRQTKMVRRHVVVSISLSVFVLLKANVFAITIRSRTFSTRSNHVVIGKKTFRELSQSLKSSPREIFDGDGVALQGDRQNKLVTFSIIPASTNPSNKFTKQLLEDVLPKQLGATEAKLLDESNGGRLTFSIPMLCLYDNATATVLDCSGWTKRLSPYGVKSLRLVVCECSILAHSNDNDSDANSSVSHPSGEDFILKTLEANLPQLELPWNIYHESFGNTPRRPLSLARNESTHPSNLEVSCRRWTSSCAISKKDFSSTRMKQALRRLLLQKYRQHARDDNDQSGLLDDCEFTLLLYKDKLRLEWTLLVPPKSKRYSEADFLPSPGCKRVEAWMLMKNLEETVVSVIKERREIHQRNYKKEVIVLDPLCGKATFLVEAATTWNTDLLGGDVSISFVGVDASDTQLQAGCRNVNAVTDGLEDDDDIREAAIEGSGGALVERRKTHDRKCTIALYRGDSRDLSPLGFEDDSVAVIATCPPFGRQFFALESDKGNASRNQKEEVLAASYRDWLREWTRVLDPHNGRIALLVDVDHREEALDAIASTGFLRVTVLREPFRLGRVRATVIVADALPHINEDNENATQKEISTEPLFRFPWEGNTKEARAEWTRLRAASLQGLEPYTKVQQSAR